MASYSVEAVLKATGAEQFARSFESATKSVQGLERTAGKMKSVGGSISGVGSQLTNAITKPALIATTAAVGLVGALGFKRLIGIDTAKAKMEGLGYSTKEVDSIMESALTSVKGTSFGLEVAATTAASAVAAGIKPGKDLTRYLSLAGDAAAIAGVDMSEMGSILNKVQTSNKAYNGELRQLADTGLPIYQWLAEEAGTTADAIFDMASDGEISSEMLLNAIETNIGGAAQIMGEKSFGAAIANAGAALGRLGASFLDGGEDGKGFFSQLKPLIGDFTDAVDNMGDKAEEMGVKVGESFMNIVEKVKELKASWDGLSEPVQNIIKKVALFGSVFLIALGPALKFLGFMITSAGHIVTAWAFLKPMFVAIGAAISGISLPVVATVGAIIAAALLIYVYWEPIKEFFISMWEMIKVAGIAIWDALGVAWSASVEFLKSVWQGVAEFFAPLWESIKEIFMMVWEPIQAAWSEVVSTLMELWSGTTAFFSEIWSEITEIFSMAWELITIVFQTAWSIIQPIVEFGMSAISKIVSMYFSIIQTVVSAAWDVISAVFTATLGVIKSVVTGAFNVMKTIISSVMNVISAIITTVWNVIKAVITTVLNVITTVVSTAFNVIKTIISTILSVVKAVVSGDFNQMQSIVSTVMSAISSIISSIWSAILSIISSVMSGIMSVISSVWNGILSTVSSIVNSIMSVVSSVFNALAGIVTSAMSGVKSAISSGMDAALAVVTGIGSAFKEAGSKIVSMIADGIKAAAGKVTGAAKDLMGKVRSFLPFSPAKEGPLKDLHKLDFTIIADGIDNSRSKVVKSAKGIADSVNNALAFDSQSDLNVGARVNGINKRANARNVASSNNSSAYGGDSGIVQNITINSPDATNPSDNARRIKRASQELAMEWR